MNVITIYRISDHSNPEKIKPSYGSKENCLRVYVREFGIKNLFVVCDNVTEETYQMVQKYVPKENIFLTSNGNTGTFLFSLELAKNFLKQVEPGYYNDIIFYFVEDDYIHRRGSKAILIEAFEYLNVDYVTLYDHPDKYQDTSDKRFEWGHGKVDEDENGIRKPGVVYGKKSPTELLISKSIHWRVAPSTTMTWATTGLNVLEDYEDMVTLHTGKRLPMGGDTFRMLKEKNKELLSPVPSFSAHAEERWLPYFINWEEEANA